MALLAGTRELDPRDLGTALLAETGELDPLERVLGLSQQRPAGLPHELQAGLGEPRMAARRSEPRTVALISPRTAGLRVLQTAVLSERQPTNLTLEPRTAALISPWMAGLRVPRTAVGLSDSRHSQRSRQTLSLYQRAWAGLRSATSLPRDRHKQEPNKNFQKMNKTKWKMDKVSGRRLLLGLVFCHGAHSREERGTRRQGLNSNIQSLIQTRQDKAGQTHRNIGE